MSHGRGAGVESPINLLAADTSMTLLRLTALALLICCSPFDQSVSLAAPITNYLAYSDRFASSGQPTSEQLTELKAGGVQRVIYIAFSDHKNSLPAEDRIVKELGLDYVHIPVIWNRPTGFDFDTFAAAMQAAPDQNTLLHCQVNFRASAFAFLYRVIYQGVPLGKAKRDMNSIWVPDETWTAFILGVLKDKGVKTDCPDCDWTPAKH